MSQEHIILASLLEGLITERAQFCSKPRRTYQMRDSFDHAMVLGGRVNVTKLKKEDLSRPNVVNWIKSRKSAEWIKENMPKSWQMQYMSPAWRTKYLVVPS